MTSLGLIRYDTACRAIANAKAVDEVKRIVGDAAQLRAYAKVAKNRVLEVDAVEIRIRAERRVGQLTKAQRETVGLSKGGRPKKTGSNSDPVSAPAKLAEAGIDKHLADRARKLSAMDDERFEHRVTGWRERQLSEAAPRVHVDILAPINHVSQNSGDNEWFTPADYIEPARRVLGGIDLDPASHAEANTVVKAKRFFTIAQNGLAREWAGRVWLNPPYARPLVDQFADKLADEFGRHAVSAAVVLVNNATETEWFDTIAELASAVCFPRGRVRFWHPRKPSAAPLQGQAVLYLGPKPTIFHAQFGGLGRVWMNP